MRANINLLQTYVQITIRNSFWQCQNKSLIISCIKRNLLAFFIPRRYERLRNGRIARKSCQIDIPGTIAKINSFRSSVEGHFRHYKFLLAISCRKTPDTCPRCLSEIIYRIKCIYARIQVHFLIRAECSCGKIETRERASAAFRHPARERETRLNYTRIRLSEPELRARFSYSGVDIAVLCIETRRRHRIPIFSSALGTRDHSGTAQPRDTVSIRLSPRQTVPPGVVHIANWLLPFISRCLPVPPSPSPAISSAPALLSRARRLRSSSDSDIWIVAGLEVIPGRNYGYDIISFGAPYTYAAPRGFYIVLPRRRSLAVLLSWKSSPTRDEVLRRAAGTILARENWFILVIYFFSVVTRLLSAALAAGSTRAISGAANEAHGYNVRFLFQGGTFSISIFCRRTGSMRRAFTRRNSFLDFRCDLIAKHWLLQWRRPLMVFATREKQTALDK